MKNTILLLMATIFAQIVSAQKIKNDEVPAAVSAAFKAKFPEAKNTKWEKEKMDIYEAEFKMNGVEKSANFDKNGVWIETETEIKKSELPANAASKISSEYPGFKIEVVCQVQSSKHGDCYEVEIEKGETSWEIIITADGKILDKKQETEEGEAKH